MATWNDLQKPASSLGIFQKSLEMISLMTSHIIMGQIELDLILSKLCMPK